MSEAPIVQYRAMTSGRRSYRFKVVGMLQLPERNYCGRLTGLKRHRFIEGRLNKREAFSLANTLNRLNGLPLHDPKAEKVEREQIANRYKRSNDSA